MLKDTKLRAKVKMYLVAANIALATILVFLFLYWLASARPHQLAKSTELGQYKSFSMSNLPNSNKTELEADYVGNLKEAVADTSEEAADIDKELANIESDNKVDNILKRTEKILEDDTQDTDSSDSGDKNTKEYKKYSGKPKIGILVTNLGLNRRATELALALPVQCGLGFLPYTNNLKPLLHKAQAKGHEIYLYLPLQTNKSNDNPGKHALMTNLANEENALRLNMILNSHARYDGVYSSYKETFTDNIHASELVFDQLDDKNLIFVLGKKLPKKIPVHISSHNNIIPTNVIIDEEPDQEYIKKQLNKLIDAAKNDGIALGYAQGFTLTIEMVREWLKILDKKGIELVPISELLKEYNS